MSKTWRIIDIVDWAVLYFQQKKFNNPRSEIEWFLRSILNCSKLDIYLRFEEPLTMDQLSILKNWVKRRIKHEPPQYITGSCDFYGRNFIISPDVLIPRQETERLIDVAMEKIKNINFPQVLDIGTGSGCIAATLAKEKRDSKILGIDISKNAIRIADKNRVALSLDNVIFETMDILTETPLNKYDILVSNPPYVAKNEMNTLMKEVKNHEPHIALTDFDDGLTFYKRIAEIGKKILKPNSWVILEVGIDGHPDRVKLIFNECNYENIELIKDYNGDERVLVAKL